MCFQQSFAWQHGEPKDVKQPGLRLQGPCVWRWGLHTGSFTTLELPNRRALPHLGGPCLQFLRHDSPYVMVALYPLEKVCAQRCSIQVDDCCWQLHFDIGGCLVENPDNTARSLLQAAPVICRAYTNSALLRVLWLSQHLESCRRM